MFDSVAEVWNDLMEIREARWVVWITILVIAILVAVYVAKGFRDMAFGGGSSDDEPLSDVEKLKQSGFILDEEYDAMKNNVAQQTLKKTASVPQDDAPKFKELD